MTLILSLCLRLEMKCFVHFDSTFSMSFILSHKTLFIISQNQEITAEDRKTTAGNKKGVGTNQGCFFIFSNGER